MPIALAVGADGVVWTFCLPPTFPTFLGDGPIALEGKLFPLELRPIGNKRKYEND